MGRRKKKNSRPVCDLTVTELAQILMCVRRIKVTSEVYGDRDPHLKLGTGSAWTRGNYKINKEYHWFTLTKDSVEGLEKRLSDFVLRAEDHFNADV